MVAKACKWILNFQCYAMEIMKDDIKNEYIDIFNTSQFACLHASNKVVIDWNE